MTESAWLRTRSDRARALAVFALGAILTIGCGKHRGLDQPDAGDEPAEAGSGATAESRTSAANGGRRAGAAGAAGRARTSGSAGRSAAAGTGTRGVAAGSAGKRASTDDGSAAHDGDVGGTGGSDEAGSGGGSAADSGGEGAPAAGAGGSVATGGDGSAGTEQSGAGTGSGGTSGGDAADGGGAGASAADSGGTGGDAADSGGSGGAGASAAGGAGAGASAAGGAGESGAGSGANGAAGSGGMSGGDSGGAPAAGGGGSGASCQRDRDCASGLLCDGAGVCAQCSSDGECQSHRRYGRGFVCTPDTHSCSPLCASCGGCEQVQVTSTDNYHTTEPIDYPDPPPTSGPHDPCWASWGVHDMPVPDERWVHNLEHGGIVYLYNCPDGCAADVATLSQLVMAQPRTLLTSYAQLPGRFAAVAWGHRLITNCVDAAAFSTFYTENFDQGPESEDAQPDPSCPP